MTQNYFKDFIMQTWTCLFLRVRQDYDEMD